MKLFIVVEFVVMIVFWASDPVEASLRSRSTILSDNNKVEKQGMEENHKKHSEVKTFPDDQTTSTFKLIGPSRRHLTTVKVESDVIPVDSNYSNSIIRYLEESNYPHMIALLIWNSSGILDRVSPISVAGWTPLNEVHLFERTKPSEHGTVAFLLGTDVLTAANWDIVPPIPFLTYTLPNVLKNDGKPYSLIPTPYDRTSFNRACIRHAEQVTLKVPFEERINVMIWRGIPHGHDPNRMILFEISKHDTNNEWIDAVNINEDPTKHMERDEMAYYKYQIDIGGESGTSWGGLRWKMCSGNLVFKVDTWSRDWWHDQIEPWKHYIPVKEDLSDLRDQYEWAESHPKEVMEIVERGIATCKESVVEDYVNKFNMNIIDSLPPATEQQMIEAKAILDGLGSFYQPLLEAFQESENKIESTEEVLASDVH